MVLLRNSRHAEKISRRAVTLARRYGNERGWTATNRVKPSLGRQWPGIDFSNAHYLRFQEGGTRPFVMWWAEGRAQPLDAGILTPSGWTTMGELKVGDKLVDPEGGESSVLGIFPQGEKKVYRVELSDGTYTEACGDHLWVVNVQGMRKPSYVWTTEKIKEFVERQDGNVGNKPVRVPQIKPVKYDSQDPLPMAPYTLGALLGDGNIVHRANICSVDQEILDRVESELPDGMYMQRNGDSIVYRLASRQWGNNPYIRSLKALGVHGKTCYDKFIPEQYKRASIQERIDLLKGIFDTDGSCDASGRAEFSSVSRQLVEDVKEVVLSLGGRCRVSEKKSKNFRSTELNGRTQYRLQNVNIPFNIFHLPRKAERFVPRDGRVFRRIVSVTPVGVKETQCIRVSAPSSLYITDNFIPTHNTIPLKPNVFRLAKGVGQPGWVNIEGKRIWRDQKWRHPGIKPTRFMEDALKQAVEENKSALVKEAFVRRLRGQL